MSIEKLDTGLVHDDLPYMAPSPARSEQDTQGHYLEAYSILGYLETQEKPVRHVALSETEAKMVIEAYHYGALLADMQLDFVELNQAESNELVNIVLGQHEAGSLEPPCISTRQTALIVESIKVGAGMHKKAKQITGYFEIDPKPNATIKSKSSSEVKPLLDRAFPNVDLSVLDDGALDYSDAAVKFVESKEIDFLNIHKYPASPHIIEGYYDEFIEGSRFAAACAMQGLVVNEGVQE